MSETVLDVLMYLFETYSEQDLETEPEPDQDVLREELLQAGFGEPEVDRALDWLDGLSARHLEPFQMQPADRSIRLFNPSSCRDSTRSAAAISSISSKSGS